MKHWIKLKGYSINSENFYSQLEVTTDFKKISNSNIYKQVPEDWFVLATDVKGSTEAIKNGQYKEVNMLGALSIISILNLDKNIEIPFVFGGDGAFVLIPYSLEKLAKQALLAIQKIALDAYKLELRIGIIPLKTIYADDKNMLISKYEVSKDYYQAMIKGGGLEYADSLLKSSKTYLIVDNIDVGFEVDTAGLECRWEAIPSPKDETISLLIKCFDEDYYHSVLQELDILLGNNAKRHPIVQKNLQLSFTTDDLEVESSVYSSSKFFQTLNIVRYKAMNYLGKLLMFLKISGWGKYKNQIVATTDTEKFDDMLRMVIAVDYEQSKNLEIYLEKEYQAKRIVYGLHKSDSALMTCLVFERHGRQIHFVDSSNGGYALAATMLKEKI